jgi:uncharacterized protein YjbI with pentapeptide repeats
LSDVDAVALSQRLPIYFATSLHDEWGSRPKEYALLKEKLDTPFTQANERAQAWLRYSTWLQKQVEEPMFLEAFSLKQVFVPLRAYYNRKVEKQTDDDIDLEERNMGNRHSTRVVVDLESALEDWLKKAKRDDAVRLISGGPGSGKSSLTKMLAAKLAAKGVIRTLFIPLHHFEPSDDLIDAVGKFIKLDGFLPYNPLDTDHREDRLLIIFDGLDELAMQGKIAERTAQDFVREVQRKVEWFNQREACIQVLIGGREVVVQANETVFRKEGQILHVLPYFLDEHESHQYIDPEKLLKQDQRQIWWQHYGKASGVNYNGLPPELDRGNITEITAQPLLNYLVALSLRRGTLKFSEETNLNAVYADLLTAIYERGWAGYQHAAIEGIKEKDFFRILEEVALASWHGNGRTTTVKEIESHCNNSGLKNLLTLFESGFEDNSKANVTRLLTAFYFRQSGHDRSGDRTFEFTHKSFGEYLTARRIIREVRLIHKKLEARKLDPDDGWDDRDALYRWVSLCGSSAMDEYLFSFILDEVRLQYLLDPATVIMWQQMFCHLIGFMIQHGMPMERLTPRPNFHEENQQSRNAEESLLAVLNSFARSTQKVSEIQWYACDSFGIWISRLFGQRQKNWNTQKLSLAFLSFLNLQECELITRDFWSANLESSNLQQAYLVSADCRYANFRRANLKQCNFAYAHLIGVKFEEADLTSADLTEVSLQGANLRRANLSRANLTNVDFRNPFGVTGSTDFRGANLEGANLEGANLKGVNLEGVNLEGANLKGANLKGANLEGANLEGANLEGANLEGTILMGKLPKT